MCKKSPLRGFFVLTKQSLYGIMIPRGEFDMLKIKSGKIVFAENKFDIMAKNYAVAICVLSGDGYFENNMIKRGDFIAVPRDCLVKIDVVNYLFVVAKELNGKRLKL